MKMPRISSSRTRQGFTLIELMVVVAVIVILSGLTLGLHGFISAKSANEKAKAQLKTMELGLQRYEADYGGYPQDEDRTGLILYMMLFGDGVGPDGIMDTEDDTEPDGESDEGAEVYIDKFDPATNELKMLNPAGRDRGGNVRVPQQVVDPWGNPWRYRAGPEFDPQNPDFDIWSLGPDGKEGTGDDIKNW